MRDVGVTGDQTCTHPISVRSRGHFHTDEAALKLLFLVLNRAEREWRMPPREWAMAKAQFAVLFGKHFTQAFRLRFSRPPVHGIPDRSGDRKSTRLNSSHANISYAVFCLKKKQNT